MKRSSLVGRVKTSFMFGKFYPEFLIFNCNCGKNTLVLLLGIFPNVKRPFRFLVLVCWLLVACIEHANAATRMALLIGNKDYQSEKPLKNPINDAQTLGKVLDKDLGFRVTIERNLKAQEMDRAVNTFIKKAKAANDLDVVIVYFSGHGMKSSSDGNYMLGIDANTGYHDSSDLKWQGIAVNQVRNALQGLKARVALVVLDACRDGPGGGKSANKGWAYTAGGENLLVAFATAEDKVAKDGDGDVGPYAQALARAWARSDLPILKQFDDVKNEVLRVTGGQKPWREGNLATDVYLLPEKAPRALDLEPSAWALCEKAQTELPCTEYLQDFPRGPRSKQARTKLADLKAATLKTTSVSASISVPASAPPVLPSVLKDCDICPELVAIPAGSFVMGDDKSSESGEKPAHTVTLAGFLLGKFEVTQGQWQALMGENPSYFKDCGDNCPVENLSWSDVQAYLKKLSAKIGKNYFLPSEAQWEYAARAGSKTAYPWGDTASDRWLNYNGNVGKLTAVGSYPANAFGLHDMHGNVWEWVADCWQSSYKQAPTDGGVWDAACDNASDRVVRGGSWFNLAANARSANRIYFSPVARDYLIGFRVARTLPF